MWQVSQVVGSDRWPPNTGTKCDSSHNWSSRLGPSVSMSYRGSMADITGWNTVHQTAGLACVCPRHFLCRWFAAASGYCSSMTVNSSSSRHFFNLWGWKPNIKRHILMQCFGSGSRGLKRSKLRNNKGWEFAHLLIAHLLIALKSTERLWAICSDR